MLRILKFQAGDRLGKKLDKGHHSIFKAALGNASVIGAVLGLRHPGSMIHAAFLEVNPAYNLRNIRIEDAPLCDRENVLDARHKSLRSPAPLIATIKICIAYRERGEGANWAYPSITVYHPSRLKGSIKPLWRRDSVVKVNIMASGP